jgi:hypothetical protein
MKFHLYTSSIIGILDFVTQEEQQLMFFGFFYCRRNLQGPVLSSLERPSRREQERICSSSSWSW